MEKRDLLLAVHFCGAKLDWLSQFQREFQGSNTKTTAKWKATYDEFLKKRKTGLAIEIENRYQKSGIIALTENDEFFLEEWKQPRGFHIVFAKGNLSLLLERSLTIVGSRKASYYGKWVCEKFSKYLIEKNIIMVSGISSGIEKTMQEVAVKAKAQNIVVLPYSFDKIQDSWARELVKKTLENNGLVLSLFPLGSAIYKTNYLFANALLASLSEGILVVEAGEKSGVQDIINHGIGFGRDILAVPGNINSEMSKLPNTLIKDGAILIAEESDLQVYLFGEFVQENEALPIFQEGEELLEKVYQSLQIGPKHIDVIHYETGLSIASLKQAVFMLMLKEYIQELSPDVYCMSR